MISSKQLRYFDALARTGHFGRAAELCSVTQPALSTQISQMEDELGVILVERRPGGMSLTPAGQEVARRAAKVLQGMSGISEFAASCRQPFALPLRLGIISTVAPYLLPQLLPRARAQYPQMVLNIRESQTQKLLADLLAAKLDVLVVALPLAHPDIETAPLMDDRFMLAVSRRSEAFAQKAVRLDELIDQRLLLLEEGHCLRDQALAICQTSRRDGADIFDASSLATLIQMVANGYGVTLLPEIGARQEASNGGIRLIPFAEPAPRRVLGLAWRTTSPRKREFDMLGQMIRAVWAPGDGAERQGAAR